uniref:F-box domain-containing protein n=1 Tax=Quercus lobata TaxID=97700 RepID=A0A7N2QY67_QUELO
MSTRGRELVENEEQCENKKMKSIVVEEQEQEEGSESGFVDLDQDTLHDVLKRVDEVTLMRVARVNKLWRKVAGECLPAILGPLVNGVAPLGFTPGRYNLAVSLLAYERVNLPQVAKPPPLDFYSIDPQVFSSQIGPWV